jgi:hypothetical protein
MTTNCFPNIINRQELCPRDELTFSLTPPTCVRVVPIYADATATLGQQPPPVHFLVTDSGLVYQLAPIQSPPTTPPEYHAVLNSAFPNCILIGIEFASLSYNITLTQEQIDVLPGVLRYVLLTLSLTITVVTNALPPNRCNPDQWDDIIDDTNDCLTATPPPPPVFGTFSCAQVFDCFNFAPNQVIYGDPAGTGDPVQGVLFYYPSQNLPVTFSNALVGNSGSAVSNYFGNGNASIFLFSSAINTLEFDTGTLYMSNSSTDRLTTAVSLSTILLSNTKIYNAFSSVSRSYDVFAPNLFALNSELAILSSRLSLTAAALNSSVHLNSVNTITFVGDNSFVGVQFDNSTFVSIFNSVFISSFFSGSRNVTTRNSFVISNGEAQTFPSMYFDHSVVALTSQANNAPSYIFYSLLMGDERSDGAFPVLAYSSIFSSFQNIISGPDVIPRNYVAAIWVAAFSETRGRYIQDRYGSLFVGFQTREDPYALLQISRFTTIDDSELSQGGYAVVLDDIAPVFRAFQRGGFTGFILPPSNTGYGPTDFAIVNYANDASAASNIASQLAPPRVKRGTITMVFVAGRPALFAYDGTSWVRITV